MKQHANKLVSLLTLSMLGVFFPFAWPRHQIYLTNLLTVLGGISLATFLGLWGYQHFGLTGAITGIVAANMGVVFVWLSLVLLTTAWLGPNPPDDPAS